MDFYTNTESAFSPMILRRFNTWYSINDGNWEDPNTWMSNALDKKTRTSPQPGDDVYVNHNVTLDILNTTYNVRNLTIQGTLNFTTSTFMVVSGNVQSNGVINMNASNAQLHLRGYFNSIATLTNHATNSFVYYEAPFTQTILPVTYCTLVLCPRNPNLSSITNHLNQVADLVCYNLQYTASSLNLSVLGQYINHNLNGFSVTVNNNYLFGSTGTVTQSINSGTFLVVGDITVSTGSCTFNFPANYQIELRGGYGSQQVQSGWNTTNALTIRYTTNNQTITIGGNNWRNSNGVNNFNHLIDGVTVTVTAGNLLGAASLTTSGWIDGTNSSSHLINKGSICYMNSQTPMATAGTIDCSSFANNFTYNTGSANINILPITYYNLYLNGSGTKKLLQNLSVNNFGFTDLTNTTPVVPVTLDTNGFNVTVSGTTNVGQAAAVNNVILSNNSLIFTGTITFGNSSGITVTGTAVLDIRGGISGSTTILLNGININAPVSFTTNNQTLNSQKNTITFVQAVTIANAITVTSSNTGGGQIIFTSTINGAGASAQLTNTSTDTEYQSATQPMATGVLDCSSTVGNVFKYNLAGNQDLTPGTYKNLTLAGSGAKKLLGNISVTNTYTLTGPATLNSNGFALTNP